MDFEFLLKKAWKYYIGGIVRLVLFFVGMLLCITIILIPTVMAGWTREILAYVRTGKAPEFNELWNFDNYAQHAVLIFIGGIIISIGFALLVVPGILLSTWWLYAMFFIVDKKMEFFEALAASKEAVTGTDFWAHVILFLILAFFNSIAGALGGVGALLTTPFSMILLTTAYINVVEPHRLVANNPR